ncbi:MAG: hypothetical protein E3J26_02215 [Candidatus Zixiibacteriota bacterium]|nr:MAG: hypothetical protein E3J26_02215 [candidate division Zixibacteria bacterium]
MTELNRNYAREFKKSQALAVALLVVAPAVYLLVACVIQIDPRTGGEVDMLFYILLIVAMVEPAVAPLIRRFHLNRYRPYGTSRMSPGQLFTSISVIELVLVELIYIYGLVVYIITGDMMRMLSFYPVALIWSVVYWPRRSAWDKFSRAIEVK